MNNKHDNVMDVQEERDCFPYEDIDFYLLEEWMNESADNNGWATRWSGSQWALCCGEWTLYHNGEEVSVEIPFGTSPANTYGQYWRWWFGGESGWEEQWEAYEDGLDLPDWIYENIEYLKQVTDDEDEYEYIYRAFQKNDWRYSSCGGCI